MSRQLSRITALISSLPEKDTSLGFNFLRERDFDSLKALVDSALYKVKKSRNDENPREEYLKVNLTELRKLKTEVDVYVAQLEPFEDYYDENFVEFGTNEEEYY
jgi:hypothetical protein|nr:MAG TPA: hypothetical protein [Crassvirales sp.]